jgi:polar amino acid transport system permease protein
VIDIYAVASRVRQDTFIIYEPLLLLALVYLVLTAILVFLFRKIEARIPARVG